MIDQYERESQHQALENDPDVAIAEAAVRKVHDAMAANENLLERIQEISGRGDCIGARQEADNFRYDDGVDTALDDVKGLIEDYEEKLSNAREEHERIKEEYENGVTYYYDGYGGVIEDESGARVVDAEMKVFCLEYAIRFLENERGSLGDEDDEESELYAARVVVKTIWDF